MAAPPTPPTTAPTGPPTTAPVTAPATPPVTAPLSLAIAAEEEAQISVAAAAASIHRDIETSCFVSGGSSRYLRRDPLCRLLTAWRAKIFPGIVHMVEDVCPGQQAHPELAVPNRPFPPIAPASRLLLLEEDKSCRA